MKCYYYNCGEVVWLEIIQIIKLWGTKLIKKGSDEYMCLEMIIHVYKWLFLYETHGIIH